MPEGAGTARVAARHRQNNSKTLWIAVGIVALLVAIGAVLSPTILQSISVSVSEEPREVALDDSGAVVSVGPGWVLEQPPFASTTTLYTPDGAVAMCFRSGTGDSQEQLAAELAATHGWPTDRWTTERSPANTVVVHQPLPQDLDAETVNETACGGFPAAMLAVIDTQSDADGQPLVTVEVGAETDLTPYLGEIAGVLSGVGHQ